MNGFVACLLPGSTALPEGVPGLGDDGVAALPAVAESELCTGNDEGGAAGVFSDPGCAALMPKVEAPVVFEKPQVEAAPCLDDVAVDPLELFVVVSELVGC